MLCSKNKIKIHTGCEKIMLLVLSKKPKKSLESIHERKLWNFTDTYKYQNNRSQPHLWKRSCNNRKWSFSPKWISKLNESIAKKLTKFPWNFKRVHEVGGRFNREGTYGTYGREGGSRGRGIPMTDSCWCMAEINTIL